MERNVAPSTQNQALNALLFFYRKVLEKDIASYIEAVKARERPRFPVVLSELEETYYLVCVLMYGGGRLGSQAVRLCVKDLDLERGLVTVYSGKGDRDRITVFPKRLVLEFENYSPGCVKSTSRVGGRRAAGGRGG
ncbi:phage integrase N-terminal SAM-like domain-containing protein [Thermosulfurimonas dismutans]|uniref:Integron integrase IntIPac n=1 Tax=Thermosulfurimonas dismutans TaxID=999894 RepID=A0A179D5T4_9BACT|nr:phage integrase N-terminal SAM-like domain-containing protein [Thermosulfurimonas dismutans]OAQ21089.1 Integron integrase IntIPac [Thermosulfurimonas dismutans]